MNVISVAKLGAVYYMECRNSDLDGGSNCLISRDLLTPGCILTLIPHLPTCSVSPMSQDLFPIDIMALWPARLGACCPNHCPCPVRSLLARSRKGPMRAWGQMWWWGGARTQDPQSNRTWGRYGKGYRQGCFSGLAAQAIRRKREFKRKQLSAN